MLLIDIDDREPLANPTYSVASSPLTGVLVAENWLVIVDSLLREPMSVPRLIGEVSGIDAVSKPMGVAMGSGDQAAGERSNRFRRFDWLDSRTRLPAASRYPSDYDADFYVDKSLEVRLSLTDRTVAELTVPSDCGGTKADYWPNSQCGQNALGGASGSKEQRLFRCSFDNQNVPDDLSWLSGRVSAARPIARHRLPLSRRRGRNSESSARSAETGRTTRRRGPRLPVARYRRCPVRRSTREPVGRARWRRPSCRRPR